MVPFDGTDATNELHTHFLADVDTSTRLHSVEKFGSRFWIYFSQENAKSNDEFHLGEFLPQGGFNQEIQIRFSWISFFTVLFRIDLLACRFCFPSTGHVIVL